MGGMINLKNQIGGKRGTAMKRKYRYCFFPYLKTSGRINYRGLFLRDIEDLEDIPENSINHIAILHNLFFLQDGQKIKICHMGFEDVQ